MSLIPMNITGSNILQNMFESQRYFQMVRTFLAATGKVRSNFLLQLFTIAFVRVISPK